MPRQKCFSRERNKKRRIRDTALSRAVYSRSIAEHFSSIFHSESISSKTGFVKDIPPRIARSVCVPHTTSLDDNGGIFGARKVEEICAEMDNACDVPRNHRRHTFSLAEFVGVIKANIRICAHGA